MDSVAEDGDFVSGGASLDVGLYMRNVVYAKKRGDKAQDDVDGVLEGDENAQDASKDVN